MRGCERLLGGMEFLGIELLKIVGEVNVLVD